jgi:hypothetical protein
VLRRIMVSTLDSPLSEGASILQFTSTNSSSSCSYDSSDKCSGSFISPHSAIISHHFEESPVFQSTVSMSDHGAEVTLHCSSNDHDSRSPTSNFATPCKSNKHDLSRSLNALFDADATPQSVQSPDTPLRAPFCGITSCCQTDGTSFLSEQVHVHICSLLESPTPVEHWWRKWSVQKPLLKQEEMHSAKIRNRSRLNPIQSQRHVENVKQDLHPFTTADKPPASLIPLQKTRSLQWNQREPHNKTVNAYRSTQGVWEYDWGCASVMPEDTLLQEEDVLCYDSDPEDFLRKPHHRCLNSSFVVEDKENL